MLPIATFVQDLFSDGWGLLCKSTEAAALWDINTDVNILPTVRHSSIQQNRSVTIITFAL